MNIKVKERDSKVKQMNKLSLKMRKNQAKSTYHFIAGVGEGGEWRHHFIAFFNWIHSI